MKLIRENTSIFNIVYCTSSVQIHIKFVYFKLRIHPGPGLYFRLSSGKNSAIILFLIHELAEQTVQHSEALL